jgi:hypothetical protein
MLFNLQTVQESFNKNKTTEPEEEIKQVSTHLGLRRMRLSAVVLVTRVAGRICDRAWFILVVVSQVSAIVFGSSDSGPTVRQTMKAAGAVLSGSRIRRGWASQEPTETKRVREGLETSVTFRPVINFFHSISTVFQRVPPLEDQHLSCRIILHSKFHQTSPESVLELPVVVYK